MHARRLDRTRTDASRRRRVAFFVLPGPDDPEADLAAFNAWLRGLPAQTTLPL